MKKIEVDLDDSFGDLLSNLVSEYVKYNWPTITADEGNRLNNFAWKMIANPKYFVYDPDTDISLYYSEQGMRERAKANNLTIPNDDV